MGLSRSDSKEFMSVAPEEIWGRKLLGGYLLGFPLKLQIYAGDVYATDGKGKEPKYSLRELSSSLHLKLGGDHLIGEMYRIDGSNIHNTLDYSHEEQVHFAFRMDINTLKALETKRNGGDISFVMKLKGLLFEDNKYYGSRWTEVEFRIEQSKWIKILNDIGYADVLLLEMPVGGEVVNPRYAHALAKIKEAMNTFHRAEWRHSVALCRDALESIEIHCPRDLKENMENSKTERFKHIYKKLIHLTHLAKHFNNKLTKETDWDKDDAYFMICSAVALISRLCVYPAELIDDPTLEE